MEDNQQEILALKHHLNDYTEEEAVDLTEDEMILAERLLPDLNKIADECMEEIWHKYDRKGRGYLPRQSTKEMLRDLLTRMGETTDLQTDDDFDRAFLEFDINMSDTIEKEEVNLFLLVMG